MCEIIHDNNFFETNPLVKRNHIFVRVTTHANSDVSGGRHVGRRSGFGRRPS